MSRNKIPTDDTPTEYGNDIVAKGFTSVYENIDTHVNSQLINKLINRNKLIAGELVEEINKLDGNINNYFETVPICTNVQKLSAEALTNIQTLEKIKTELKNDETNKILIDDAMQFYETEIKPINYDMCNAKRIGSIGKGKKKKPSSGGKMRRTRKKRRTRRKRKSRK
jgi:hypothetical protein